MIFYKNESFVKTYADLIYDINNKKELSYVINSKNTYDIFLSLLISLISKKPVILVDSDFSENEIIGLGLKEDINIIYNIKFLEVKDIDDLKKRIFDSGDWGLTLFTSGTTGLPKKVSHTLNNLIRNVKISDKYSKSIWGYAFNPTHIAGIQVFFQALLNVNSIIDLFQKSRDIVINEINNSRITNISATTTYYRLLSPYNFTCKSVEMLTSGGERFDTDLFARLKCSFPNAKFRNIYASTEAGTIFSSKGDYFVIAKEMMSKIKVENSELLIKSELIGEISYGIDEWYSTGDIVEILEDNPLKLKFLYRKNEMINIGGYKVNPGEIESVIRLYSDVQDVVVYGKPNSVIGNILCADIVSLKVITEKEIREFLSNKLQKFKMPRIINIVESLNITRTGKISR